MHDWKIASRPWPGIRVYHCAECGKRAQLVGKELNNRLEALARA